jgi:hypothetical protein
VFEQHVGDTAPAEALRNRFRCIENQILADQSGYGVVQSPRCNKMKINAQKIVARESAVGFRPTA